MRPVLVTALALCGCGRLAFEPFGDAPESVPDARVTHEFDFEDFTVCPAELVFVGVASCATGVIVVTPDATGQVGAAYFQTPMTFTEMTRLSTHVALSFPDASASPPGDGAVIVIQADPRGTSAIGGGASLGYNSITPSIGVELDTFKDTIDPPNANHMGIDRDGSVTSVTTFELPFAMNGGSVFHVWIDYVGTTTTFDAYAAMTATKPATPQLSIADDLSRLGTQARLGIVAGTAFAAQGHHVLAWDLVVTD